MSALGRTALRLRQIIEPSAEEKYLSEVARNLRGIFPRECPCCGFGGMFRGFGHPPRYDAQCPSCGSLERHRLLVLAFNELGIFKPTDRVLHFAAEQAIADYAQPRVALYQTCELHPGDEDLVRDLEDIAEDDASVDVVIANHVLEHVNDRRALSELHRILRPGGRLVATVPLIEGWDVTYENPAVTNGPGRERHFGQHDHVRYYGRDFRERVRDVGFDLTEYAPTGEATDRFGLLRGERAFFATKA